MRTVLVILIAISWCLIPLKAEGVGQTLRTGLSGLGATVMIDQPEYWTDFMPPGWRPADIEMSLLIFNSSPLPASYSFRTSQRYDFAVFNEEGEEVWRWSNGKSFLPVTGQVTLQPGESMAFREKVQFVDRDGRPMPVGLYRIEGSLASCDQTLSMPWHMGGTVSFWHRYVH